MKFAGGLLHTSHWIDVPCLKANTVHHVVESEKREMICAVNKHEVTLFIEDVRHMLLYSLEVIFRIRIEVSRHTHGEKFHNGQPKLR